MSGDDTPIIPPRQETSKHLDRLIVNQNRHVVCRLRPDGFSQNPDWAGTIQRGEVRWMRATIKPVRSAMKPRFPEAFVQDVDGGLGSGRRWRTIHSNKSYGHKEW